MMLEALLNVKVEVEDIEYFLKTADLMGIGFDSNNYYYLDNKLRNYVRLFLGSNELEENESLLKEFVETVNAPLA